MVEMQKCRNSQQAGFKWANTHPQTRKALLKYEQAARPADFGHFFQCSECTKCFPHCGKVAVEPLRCVLERSSLAHWLSEKVPICLDSSQGFQHNPKVQLRLLGATASVHREHTGNRAHARQGYWWCQAGRSEGAGSVQVAGTLVCFPCQWSTLQ